MEGEAFERTESLIAPVGMAAVVVPVPPEGSPPTAPPLSSFKTDDSVTESNELLFLVLVAARSRSFASSSSSPSNVSSKLNLEGVGVFVMDALGDVASLLCVCVGVVVGAVDVAVSVAAAVAEDLTGVVAPTATDDVNDDGSSPIFFSAPLSVSGKASLVDRLRERGGRIGCLGDVRGDVGDDVDDSSTVARSMDVRGDSEKE